jgi:hypothetical protein
MLAGTSSCLVCCYLQPEVMVLCGELAGNQLQHTVAKQAQRAKARSTHGIRR